MRWRKNGVSNQERSSFSMRIPGRSWVIWIRVAISDNRNQACRAERRVSLYRNRREILEKSQEEPFPTRSKTVGPGHSALLVKIAVYVADIICGILYSGDRLVYHVRRRSHHFMSGTKRISIEQLRPGMFIVEMDLPWYRTPFLFHKRLIQDRETIAVMKQHGVQSVTIDTAKGIDVQEAPVLSAAVPAHPVGNREPAAPAEETVPGTPMTPPAGESAQAVAASVYTEAQETMERIFADLERGVPPTPAETKVVVTGVLNQVLNTRSELILHSTFLKVKQFDRSLGAHALDTAILSLVVAVESGVDPALYEHLGTGALLHDVGYVRLPRNLVRKRDECNESERRLLEQHTQLGTAVLGDQSGFHDDVCRIVMEHHERCDGSGFPRQLKAQDIAPLAQIVGIVDFYDKLVSRRGGRPAMIPHDAVRQLFLVGERGQYPKSLVEAVIRSIGVYPVGSLVRLNTGEQAVVVGVNPEQRLKPQVKITGGPHGESYVNPERVDLSLPAQGRGARTVLRVLDPVQERVNIAMYLGDLTDQAA